MGKTIFTIKNATQTNIHIYIQCFFSLLFSFSDNLSLTLSLDIFLFHVLYENTLKSMIYKHVKKN